LNVKILIFYLQADAKKTIIIREGDTSDELAGRFSHRYGLKRRDAELVRERIGRQIYASQRDTYDDEKSNNNGVNQNQNQNKYENNKKKEKGGNGKKNKNKSHQQFSQHLQQNNLYENLNGPFSPSPEKNRTTRPASQNTPVIDFPSNLTPSQRSLLMMTLGKGVELQTPWQTPSTATNRASHHSSHSLPNTNNTNNTFGSKSNKGRSATAQRKTPILRMQIEIAGTPSSLTVHEGDNVKQIARKFVHEHSLPPSAVESISQVIDNAVKEEKKRQRGGGNKSRR
jgi:hypothetical protein